MKTLKKIGRNTLVALLSLAMLVCFTPANLLTALAADGDDGMVTVTFHTGLDTSEAYFGDESDASESYQMKFEEGEWLDNDSIDLEPTILLENVYFGGWSANPDQQFNYCGGEFEGYEGYEAEDGLELYAVYKECAIVTLDANGGTLEDPEADKEVETLTQEYVLDDYFDCPEPTPASPTDIFLGWFDADDNQYDEDTQITESVTLTARWNKPEIIDVNLDEEFNVTEENSGSSGAYFVFKAPEKGSYKITLRDFDESSKAIYAYKMDDGELSNIAQTSTDDAESIDCICDLEKDEMLYVMFDDNYGGGVTGRAKITKTVKVNVTFYINNDDAYRNGKAYYVVWDPEEEEEVNSDSVVVNVEAGTQLGDLYANDDDDQGTWYNPPEHSGDIFFMGWARSPEATTPESDIIYAEEGLKLYGVWSSGYEVTYDLNTSTDKAWFDVWDEEEEDWGSSTTKKTYVPKGTTITGNTNPGFRYDDEELTFCGWSTKQSAKTPDQSIEITENKTVYAVWKDVHKITFDANGGVIYNDDDDDSLTKTTYRVDGSVLRTSYVAVNSDPFKAFIGWFDRKTGGNKYGEKSVVTGDLTLYAHWRELEPIDLTEKAGSPVKAASPEDTAANRIVFEFTPTEDGYYVFNTADAKDLYPRVALYDSNKNRIGSDYRSAMNKNASLVQELEAEQTYYYSVTNEKNGAFSYPVEIEKVPTATVTFNPNMEGATVKDGSQSSETLQKTYPAGYYASFCSLDEYEDDEDGIRAVCNDSKYHFAGWHPSAKSEGNGYEEMIITGDMTLYAVWEEFVDVNYHAKADDANADDVYFKVDGEKTFDVQESYRKGADLLDEWTPTVYNDDESKVFAGWSVNKNATAPDEEIIASDGLDLYPVWTTKEAPQTIGINSGETKQLSTNAGMVWLEFTPSEDGTYALISSEKGKYDPYAELYDKSKEEKLAYNDDGAGSRNFYLSYEMEKGKTYYYKARCYSSDESTFGYTVTLKKVKKCKVTLNINSDSNDVWFKVGYRNLKGKKTIETEIPEGVPFEDALDDARIDVEGNEDSAAFIGWSTNKNASEEDESIEVTGSMTVYCVWADKVAVTFDANREGAGFYTYYYGDDEFLGQKEELIAKGTVIQSEMQGDSDSYLSPVCDDSDYAFLGWSTNKNAVKPDEKITISGAATLYAVWAKSAFVTYCANTGYYSSDGVIYTERYDNTDSLLDPEYIPETYETGKVLAGFALTPDASANNVIDMKTAAAKDYDGKTLYAVWIEGIKVTLHANGSETNKAYFCGFDDEDKTETLVTYVAPGSKLSELDIFADTDTQGKGDFGYRSLTADGAALDGSKTFAQIAGDKKAIDLYVIWKDSYRVRVEGEFADGEDWFEWNVEKGKAFSSKVKELPAPRIPDGKKFNGWRMITGGTEGGLYTDSEVLKFVPTSDVTFRTEFVNKDAPTPEKIDISGAEVTKVVAKTYTGKALTQDPVVKVNGITLTKDTDYTLKYGSNVNAGTASMYIEGIGKYTGKKTIKFKINKKAQKPTIKGKKKTIRAAQLKKGKKTVKGLIKVTKPVGKVTYTKVKSGSSGKLTINKKSGKITIKKGTQAGKYTIKVKVKAAGNKNIKSYTKTVKVKITVRK